MRIRFFCAAVALCLLMVFRSPAATLYVDLNSHGPAAPYATWATAATNIQDAVDAANAGDTVLVTNGVYATGARVVHGALSNRVAITKPVVVQSVNGPLSTVIKGFQVPGTTNGDGAIRGVYLTNGATIAGFTITNGATRTQGDVNTEQAGGGVGCDTASATVYNCILSGNVANDNGGGIIGGTLSNCTLLNNSAQYSGGGASSSILNNCFIYKNATTTGGGGAVNSTLENCTVVSNFCQFQGGGTEFCTVFNSIVYFNSNDNWEFCSFNYSCMQPLAGGTGNTSLDPQFSILPQLAPTSPAIGAGNLGYASGVDIIGQTWSTPPSMGCAEYHPVTGSMTVNAWVSFNSLGTNVSDNFTASIVTGRAGWYRWDFGDGTQTSNALTASHAWGLPGAYQVVFTAFNDTNPGGVSVTNVVSVVPATIHYVSLASTAAQSPFTSWATAATNIQDAIDSSIPGDIVLVTNGVYQTGGRVVYGAMSNRVAVTLPLIVESVNGPAVTVIQGSQVPGSVEGDSAMRCVYLTNGASLLGFTLTNGATRILGNVNYEQTGGGVWSESTGATVFNCILTGNGAYDNGGGAYSGTLNNCLLLNNSASSSGGGASRSTLNNCFVFRNSTGSGGGGVVNALLNNCTVVSNTCTGSLGGGADNSVLNNCIVYFNSGGTAPNYAGCNLNYCDTVPLPGTGNGNISADPQLALLPHLSPGSPCIGGGSAMYTSGTDIDGESWLNPPSIGCDEFQAGGLTGPLSVTIQDDNNQPLAGRTVDFTAIISGRAYSNRWSFGDGTAVLNQTSVSHIWTVAGDFSVSCTFFNDSNPGGITATDVVHVLPAPIHYVSLSSTNPVSPYSSWATAATSIQDAVDATPPGDIVLVTNGIYATGGRLAPGGSGTNRIAVTNAITVQSVNGYSNTIIVGLQVVGTTNGASAIRCAYLSPGAVLCGFTLTNGATPTAAVEPFGGGVYYAGKSGAGGIASNCLIIGNSAARTGGGAYGVTLSDCTLLSNTTTFSVGTTYGGGGAAQCTLSNCLIMGNSAPGAGGGTFLCNSFDTVLASNYSAGYGGGAFAGTLVNCSLISNYAATGGGIVSGTLTNCILIGNNATGIGGGTAFLGYDLPSSVSGCLFVSNSASTGGAVYNRNLINCTLIGNSAVNGGGFAGDRNYSASAINCLFASNSASQTGGAAYGTNTFTFASLQSCVVSNNTAGVTGGGSYQIELANCIITANSAQQGGGSASDWLSGCTLVGNTATVAGGGEYLSRGTNCIILSNTAPSGANFTNSSDGPLISYCCTTPMPDTGFKNITNEPLFVDFANGNFRLQPNSPCINSGSNLALFATSPDLDGNPRISGGTQDIGAYEFQNPASIISYAWLQQYGLATDGSADNVDSDGDGMSNYAEWRAGTNPTDAASVLRLASPVTAGGNSLVINWQSVTNEFYYLQRAPGLSPAAFQTVVTNIPGQSGTTSFTDTNAPAPGPWFYRVGVQ